MNCIENYMVRNGFVWTMRNGEMKGIEYEMRKQLLRSIYFDKSISVR